jgi:hypothetical protein
LFISYCFGVVGVFHFLLSFLCCPIMCLYVLSSVLWCPLRFLHRNDVLFVFTSSGFLWIVHFWLPLWCSLTFIIFNLQFQFSAFHEHHISNIIFKTANVIVCGNYLHKLTIYLFSAIQYCQNPISRLISWYLVFSNIFIYVPVESRVLAKNRLLTINEL